MEIEKKSRDKYEYNNIYEFFLWYHIYILYIRIYYIIIYIYNIVRIIIIIINTL